MEMKMQKQLQRWRNKIMGDRPRITDGYFAELLGEDIGGGYIAIRSQDLPGFRLTLSPGQSDDIERIIEALKPALNMYLRAYLSAQDHADMKKHLRIQSAQIPSRGKPFSAVAELCP